MKSAILEKPLDQTSEAVAVESRPQVSYATVYTFVVYDHDKGATKIYPRMATREAVAMMRGKVNEDTAWVVETSALDVEGFYSGDLPEADWVPGETADLL